MSSEKADGSQLTAHSRRPFTRSHAGNRFKQLVLDRMKQTRPAESWFALSGATVKSARWRYGAARRSESPCRKAS